MQRSDPEVRCIYLFLLHFFAAVLIRALKCFCSDTWLAPTALNAGVTSAAGACSSVGRWNVLTRTEQRVELVSPHVAEYSDPPFICCRVNSLPFQVDLSAPLSGDPLTLDQSQFSRAVHVRVHVDQFLSVHVQKSQTSPEDCK